MINLKERATSIIEDYKERTTHEYPLLKELDDRDILYDTMRSILSFLAKSPFNVKADVKCTSFLLDKGLIKKLPYSSRYITCENFGEYRFKLEVQYSSWLQDQKVTTKDIF